MLSGADAPRHPGALLMAMGQVTSPWNFNKRSQVRGTMLQYHNVRHDFADAAAHDTEFGLSLSPRPGSIVFRFVIGSELQGIEGEMMDAGEIVDEQD